MIYLLFLSIFFLDFLSKELGVIPRAITWVPELLSIAAVITIIVNVVNRRELSLGPAYIVLFLFLALLLTATTIANAVQPGAIFNGMRTYLKYMPFFFLPAVVCISGGKLLSQLKFLLALVLLQIPLSLYQRFIQYAGLGTGDVVVGSINTPSALTIVSLSAVAIVLSAYYKTYIKKTYAYGLIAVLLIPPTINETTITLFYLPLAFIIPTLFYARHAEEKKRLLVMTFLGIIALGVFATGYDYMYGDRWGGSITNIIVDQDVLIGDLAKENATDDIATSDRKIGRLDSIRFTYEYLSQEPTMILMGVGLGNANSSFSQKLRGDYSLIKTTKGGDMIALSSLLWEIGIVGALLTITVFIKIFFDAKSMVYRDDIYGVLALGWLVVTSFILLTMLYKNLIPHNVLGYVFWYLSGCLISEKYRTAIAQTVNKAPYAVNSPRLL